jgi:hypothetical protein
VAEIRERYQSRADHEIHRVTYRGGAVNGWLRAREEIDSRIPGGGAWGREGEPQPPARRAESACGVAPPHSEQTPDSAAGLLEVHRDEETELGGVLRVSTIRGSAGLSRVLEAILRAGGTVLGCSADHVSFDEVFCSLVLEDRPRAETSETAP